MNKRILIFILSLACVLCHGKQTYSFKPNPDAWLMGGGLLLNGVGGLFCYHASPPEPETLSASEVFSADRIALRFHSHAAARLSDWTLMMLALGPLAMTIRENSRTGRWDESGLYLESQLWTLGLTNLFKGIIHRPRPYVYSQSSVPPDKDASRSFFSGHTSIAFTGAVSTGLMFDHFYPDSKWSSAVWISSLSLASATGLFRVLAGKHFPTDVLAGALVGSLIGWVVPKIHEERVAEAEHAASQPLLFKVQLSL